ncbi:MAG TPA: sulfur carrier protein ThiS [Bryobacteraceae bacterium]|jgi:sulfur carrier protein|nr:sulfur carrier protein ThiS [Bryobacteraceae bacterium]
MSNVRTKEIQIVVNGQVRSVREGQTLTELLKSLEIAGDRVAVELDRKIIHRSEWDSTTIGPGAALEIVQFVGGG